MESPPAIGQSALFEPGLRRIIAPNASPMTYWGTNTFLLGTDKIAVIDPGPDRPEHLAALMAATDGQRITHIFVTHSHLDHSPLAKPLSEATGAKIHAFGDSLSGRSNEMIKLAKAGLAGGGEGVDRDFAPDVILVDGQIIQGDGWRLTAWHTPGHMGNHLAFQWGDVVFTGDLVMGWASTMVSPPDGDLGDFLASCEKLRDLGADRFYPGHGDVIEGANDRLDWLVAHRQSRTDQIVSALGNGPATVADLTKAIYHDAPPGLFGAASRNVFAHLIHMATNGVVTAEPTLQEQAVFSLV